MNDVVAEPSHPEILAFWEVAMPHAKLNGVRAYAGPSVLETLAPPAWSFGESPEQADEFVARLLESGKIEVVTPAAAYAEVGESLPTVGTMSILCDGSGRPRALLVGAAVLESDIEGVASVTETLSVVHSVD